jgi:hypothetical protein
VDNLAYSVKIRALDDRKAPSAFSSVLTFTTRNIPPLPVVEVLRRKEKYTGGPGIDVRLTWAPAQDPDGLVTMYRVYEKSNREYRLVGATRTNRHIVKTLGLDSTYIFEVRSVDNRGAESLKNKSFTVSTRNDPPDPPAGIEQKQTLSRDQKSFSIKLSWPPADDIDGVISKYRIYVKKDGKESLYGETIKTSYTLEGLDTGSAYSFNVRAVDNRGMESGEKPVKRPAEISEPAIKEAQPRTRPRPRRPLQSTGATGLNLTGRYAFLLPLRDFAEMYGMGHGAMISLRHDRVGMDGITLGVDAGFYYFPGNSELFDYSMMTPLFLALGYKARITGFFMISPEAGFGGACIVNKNDSARAGRYGLKKNETAVEPAFFTGLQFNFLIGRGLAVNIGVDYSALIEKSGLMDFMVFYAEMGYRF